MTERVDIISRKCEDYVYVNDEYQSALQKK